MMGVKHQHHQEEKRPQNGSSDKLQQHCLKGAILLATYLSHQLRSSLLRVSKTSATLGSTGALNRNKRNRNEKLNCSKCGWLLQQAVTLLCGHSMCRKCCCNNINTASSTRHRIDAECEADVVRFEFQCGKCEHRQEEEPKTNVTVMAIVESWWKDQLEAVEWRHQGDQQEHIDIAIECYDKALQSGIIYFTFKYCRDRLFHDIISINCWSLTDLNFLFDCNNLSSKGCRFIEQTISTVGTSGQVERGAR